MFDRVRSRSIRHCIAICQLRPIRASIESSPKLKHKIWMTERSTVVEACTMKTGHLGRNSVDSSLKFPGPSSPP